MPQLRPSPLRLALPRLSPPACGLALAACLAAGCAAPPDIPRADDAAAQAAPYPALIPLGPVLAQASAAQGAANTPDSTAAVDARLAALAARAAALRGPVLEDATSARMANALR